MAVDQPNVVDIIGKNKDGEIVLTISDHLGWDDCQAHLQVLQEKINTYLTFVETGELYQKYPEARGLPVVIEVMFHYPLLSIAHAFLASAKRDLGEAGVAFRYQMFAATPFQA